jgi:uncharacterized C2H2 Zn-finger protein
MERQEPQRNPEERIRFRCERCGQTFNSREELNDHRNCADGDCKPATTRKQ